MSAPCSNTANCCISKGCPPISSRFVLGKYNLMNANSSYYHDHYHRHIHCDEYVIPSDNTDCVVNAVAASVFENDQTDAVTLKVGDCCSAQLINQTFAVTGDSIQYEFYPLTPVNCQATEFAEQCTLPAISTKLTGITATLTAEFGATGLYPFGYFTLVVDNNSTDTTVSAVYAFVGQADNSMCMIETYNISSGQLTNDNLSIGPGQECECNFGPFSGETVSADNPYIVILNLKTFSTQETCCTETQAPIC